MKRFFFLVLILFAAIRQEAQTTGITGTTIDSATGKALGFVTVRLLDEKDSLIHVIFSDSAGAYQFNPVSPGRYKLSFNFTGYTPSSSPAFTLEDALTFNAGVQHLSPDIQQLSQVNIISRKPVIEKSMDGIIYNVQQDLLAAGGTAIDVLRKTPMVSVGQDGSPSIRGSANIRVYIDDKPSDLYASNIADALRLIPAEEIVRIEVILYPSAKYDAEGTDGVIHIITRKNKMNGMNGTVSVNIGNRPKNFNATINIRRDKWILSTTSGWYYYKNRNGNILHRNETGNDRLYQTNEWISSGKTFFSGGNIIYVLDSLKNIYGGYRYRVNNSLNNRVLDNQYYTGVLLTNSFRRYSDTEWDFISQSMNTGYSSKSKNQKNELKLLATYFKGHMTNAYDLEQWRSETVDYRENFNGRSDIKELILQADYSANISAVTFIEGGIKSMNRESRDLNRFDVYEFSSAKFINDALRENNFMYERNIYAAYTNLRFSFKTWQIRLGVRYEQTLLKAEFKDTSLRLPDFKNLVPSVLVNKTLSDKHTLRFSYSQQLLRPYLNYLNPFIDYSDSLNLQYGNPYLVPEITHRYEIGYTGNFGKFVPSIAFFYTRNPNGIEQVRFPIGNGIVHTTYRNIGKRNIVGFTGNVSWRNEKISISSNFTLRYIDMESAALQLSRHGWNFNTSVNFSYKFPRNYSIETTTNFNSKDIRLQGWREGWKFGSIAVNKKLNKDKLTISLRSETYNHYMTEDIITPIFFQRTVMRYQNFFILLGLSWKFGTKEIKMPATQQATQD
jgi:outer membrane receptor protein involved in Fe transport